MPGKDASVCSNVSVEPVVQLNIVLVHVKKIRKILWNALPIRNQ